MTYSSLARTASVLFALVALGACSHNTMVNTGANPRSSAAQRGLPNGVTALMVAQGDSIFHARSCRGCHGADAKGGQNGPNLTTGQFMHVNGSYDDFVRIITDGIPRDQIKDPAHTRPMPARGGSRPAPLTDEQVRAVAAYVYSLNHQG